MGENSDGRQVSYTILAFFHSYKFTWLLINTIFRILQFF